MANLCEKYFSFSSVTSFNQCPYAFYLRYVQDAPDHDNAFAQSGSLVHELLESWAKGELSAFELADEFDARWNNKVTCRFPFFKMGEGIKNKCRDYLVNFDGFDGEIIAVEHKFKTEINGVRFVGFADLILRDDKGLIIIDHKSHNKFTKKEEKEKEEYLRQLYLYAECVKQEFGEYPYMLRFNHFKSQGFTDEMFDADKCAAACKWFCDSVAEIIAKPIDSEWECRTDDFKCSHLCGMRDCIFNGGN